MIKLLDVVVFLKKTVTRVCRKTAGIVLTQVMGQVLKFKAHTINNSSHGLNFYDQPQKTTPITWICDHPPPLSLNRKESKHFKRALCSF